VLPVPKMVRFMMLNASARRSARTFSVIRNDLATLTFSVLVQNERTFGL
jgi:hypothetical protein